MALDKTYIHKGKFYGPESQDVPEALLKHIASQQPKAQPDQQPTPDERAVAEQPDAPVVPRRVAGK